MLVVHPQDRTTDVLKLLYEGLEAKVITKECSNRMMGQFLHSTSIRDRGSPDKPGGIKHIAL